MKRTVLVLELLADEAAIIETAIANTEVRFAGRRLDELLRMSRSGMSKTSTDGTEVTQIQSDGVSYQSMKPVTVEI